MNLFDTITDPIDQTIATGLARISTVMRSEAWARSVNDGITPTQSDILTLLGSRDGPVRLSTIAAQLAISAATASEAVSTLVGKGLVEKVRASDDGRAVSLTLSAHGKELASTAGEFSGLLSIGLQVLSADEKVALLRMVVKIIRAMQDRGAISITRMCLTCKFYDGNKATDPLLPHYCNLVGSAFADRHIRIECPEHQMPAQGMFLVKKLQ